MGTRRPLHPKPNHAEQRSCPSPFARRRSWRNRSATGQAVKKTTARWGQMASGDSRWILGSPQPQPARKLRDHRDVGPMERLDVTRGQEAIPSASKRGARNAEPHTGGEQHGRGRMDISGLEEGSHSEGDPKEPPENIQENEFSVVKRGRKSANRKEHKQEIGNKHPEQVRSLSLIHI